MKKVITIIVAFTLLLFATACSGYSEDQVNRMIDAAYNRGYEDAKEDASDVLFDYADDIATLSREAILECELTASEKYCHPEDALLILENYLNGESVSKTELRDALDGLTEYYYDTQNIDDYVYDNIWSVID